MSKENREYKGDVFIDLLQNDEKAAENSLSVYNAVNGTNYTDLSIVKHVTLKNTVYRGIKNDVAYMIGDTLMVLIEHQSTINPNMPFRALLYIGRLYEKLFNGRERYCTKLLEIPAPKIYVFYNGTDDYPLESTLKLSDAYKVKSDDILQLELTVRIFNINISGKEGKRNIPLLEKCAILKEYSEFVDIYRENIKNGVENPAEKTIEYCVSNGILRDYLLKAGDEVVGYLISEYDYDTDIAVRREEAVAEGIAEGDAKRGEKDIASIKNSVAKGIISEETAEKLIEILSAN